MHHQSKERNMSKSKRKKKKKKKKLTRAFPFGLARFRFNEVRINEVPLYNVSCPFPWNREEAYFYRTAYAGCGLLTFSKLLRADII